MNRVSRYGTFPNTYLSGDKPHVAAAVFVVVLDIIAGDLDVAYVAFFNLDTAASIVADVRRRDIDLMQIDVIEIDADSPVVVDVDAVDENVTIVPYHVDPVSAIPNDKG